MSDLNDLFGDLPPEKPVRGKKGKKNAPEIIEESIFTASEPVSEDSPSPSRETAPLDSLVTATTVKPEVLPTFLDRVWGQERPKKILQRLIEENHLPHALLLYGPDGIGKQILALELARHLNCEWGPLTACGVCASCRQFESLQVSSIFLAFPTKANEGEIDKKDTTEEGDTRIIRRYSPKTDEEIALAIAETAKDYWVPLQVPGATNLRVITIRFLRQWAQLGTWLGKGRKVAILAQAHRMNEETSNALLKILEEPPPDTLLILLTKSPEDLLPTIQSRCQSIRMEPLPSAIIAKQLLALPNTVLNREDVLKPEDADEIALLAEGNFIHARELAASDTSVKTEAAIEFLVGCVTKNKHRDMLMQIDQYSRGRNIEEVEKFLIRVVLFLRDALRVRQHRGEGLPEGLVVRGNSKAAGGGTLLDRLRRFENFTRKSDLVLAIDEVVRAHDVLRRRNPQVQLLLHALSFKLSRILSV